MTNDRFLDDLENTIADVYGDNFTETENGAVAHTSTGSRLLDFFSVGGALRDRDESEILKIFNRALAEDELRALKALFYFRDIRGGQGERATFRTILRDLAKNNPGAVRRNLINIARYGRWDDMYALVGTPLERDVFSMFRQQLSVDVKTDRPSLLAKWLKSENTSSKDSRRFATKTRKALGLSSKDYRKMLSMLRERIGIVEQQISDNNWEEIEYGKLPSKAGLQYRNAFLRHDPNRYSQFLEDVKSGKATINTGTLYPYEIVEKLLYGDTGAVDLDVFWDNLPNFFEGNEGVRGLVVADVSGSMHGRPMAVSISLALYTAERNTGPFAGKYMTFTDRPRLIKIDLNSSLAEKVAQVEGTDVGYNTNIEAVFDVILKTAVENRMPQSHLPTHLYMVSDMEFDAANSNWSDYSEWRVTKTLFQTIKEKYERAGYEMPFLVFWNVNSRNNQQPMSLDERGFQLVSGCSPSIFESLLANKVLSAYDLMLTVLDSERYSYVR